MVWHLVALLAEYQRRGVANGLVIHTFQLSGEEGIVRTAYLEVTGMRCAGCAGVIALALKEMGGVRDVEVSFLTNEAKVEYDEQLTSQHKLQLAVMGAGYGIVGLYQTSGSDELLPP